MIYLGNQPVGVCEKVGKNTKWVCPDGWPDLESVSIPASNTENTIFLLYQKGLGYDGVDVRFGSKQVTVSRGTITNGEFVGEAIGTNVTSFTDTLENEFTVYKIVGSNTELQFYKTTLSSYSESIQSVVWVYGNAPKLTTLGNSGNYGPFGNHTVRFKLYNTIAMYYMTFPNLPKLVYYPDGFWMGVTQNGDFADTTKTLSRTGNGTMFYQYLEDDKIVTIQNTKVDLQTGRFNKMVNIKFKNVYGQMKQQAFQDNYFLKHIEFENCHIDCISAYYMFSNCIKLQYCDLSDVDFSTATNSGTAFSGCSALEVLKLNNTWKMDLNISACRQLQKDSLIQIFRDLPTIESTKTISLPAGIKNYYLSEDDIAIATAKGWTVS